MFYRPLTPSQQDKNYTEHQEASGMSFVQGIPQQDSYAAQNGTNAPPNTDYHQEFVNGNYESSYGNNNSTEQQYEMADPYSYSQMPSQQNNYNASPQYGHQSPPQHQQHPQPNDSTQ
jgi:hypothetical protein